LSRNESVGEISSAFGGFDLLATSAQYLLKEQDTRSLVVLTAWKGDNLEKVWKVVEPKPEGLLSFKEQLYYSAGSVQQLLRPISGAESRVNAAIAQMTKETCEGLLAGYGGDRGTGTDTLRCWYLKASQIKSYTTVAQWHHVVDSAYVLNQLSNKAPLGVYLRILLGV
jgi:hypothetical protein